MDRMDILTIFTPLVFWMLLFGQPAFAALASACDWVRGWLEADARRRKKIAWLSLGWGATVVCVGFVLYVAVTVLPLRVQPPLTMWLNGGLFLACLLMIRWMLTESREMTRDIWRSGEPPRLRLVGFDEKV